MFNNNDETEYILGDAIDNAANIDDDKAALLREAAKHLSAEEFDLELAHEIKMGEAAIEAYREYATKSLEREMPGDVRELQVLIHRACNRCWDAYQKHRPRLDPLAGQNRNSVAECIFGGRSLTLRSASRGYTDDKKVKPTKKVHKYDTPGLNQKAIELGHLLYAQQANEVESRSEGQAPPVVNPTDEEAMEAGLRVMFALTAEAVVSYTSPDQMRQKLHKATGDTDKEKEIRVMSLGHIGKAIGLSVRETILHVDQVRSCPRGYLINEKALSEDYRHNKKKRRVDVLAGKLDKVTLAIHSDRIQKEHAAKGNPISKEAADEIAKAEVINDLSQARQQTMARWNNDVMMLTGILLLEILLEATGWGKVKQPSDTRLPAYVIWSEEFFRDFDKCVARGLTRERANWPMLVEPMPWRPVKARKRKHSKKDVQDPINVGGSPEKDLLDVEAQGGYLMQKRDLLIRNRARQSREVIAAYNPETDCWLKALNRSQRTALELNPMVLEVLQYLKKEGRNLDSFVVTNITDKYEVPQKYWAQNRPEKGTLTQQQADEWEANRQRWNNLAESTAKVRLKELGRIRRVVNTMNAVEQFINQTFYQPWSLDSRGRMYPINNVLSTQGPDFERSLIRAATHVPLPAVGEVQRFIIELPDQSIKTIDVDREKVLWFIRCDVAVKQGDAAKESWNDRSQWTLDNEAMLRQVVADPIGTINIWEKFDEPFGFLAAADEYIRILDGEQDYCQVFGSLDGTCSGLQHLTAATRDDEIAALVNLTESSIDDAPGDIYTLVSDTASALADERAKAGNWVDPRLKTERLNYEWEIDRNAAKVAGTMTLAYNSTYESARENLEDLLVNRKTPYIKPVVLGSVEKTNAKGEVVLDKKTGQPVMRSKTTRDVDPRFYNYVDVLWTSVRSTLRKPIDAMQTINRIFDAHASRQTALGISSKRHWHEPFTFRTPSGFTAAFFKPTIDTHASAGFDCKLRLPSLSTGGARWLRLSQMNYKRCNWQAIRSSIAPGVIHALDATTMHILVGKLWPDKKQELPITLVHDAVLTPGIGMALAFELGKEAFYSTHTESALVNLRDQTEGAADVEMPEFGDWIPQDVRLSSFTFS